MILCLQKYPLADFKNQCRVQYVLARKYLELPKKKKSPRAFDFWNSCGGTALKNALYGRNIPHCVNVMKCDVSRCCILYTAV
jgi:hypothetical protein